MKFKALGITFIVAVLAAIVAGVYFWQAGTLGNFEYWQLPAHKSATANWETYTNTEYGFEFKYPRTWIVNTTPLSISIRREEPHDGTDTPADVDISINSKISDLDWKKLDAINLADFVDKYSKGEDPYLMNVQAVTLGNKNGFKALAGPNVFAGGMFYFFENSNSIIEIKLPDQTEEANQKQILSTFKFPDSNSSTPQPQAGKGILTGHVTVGPNCPVERIDNPCEPSAAAYTGRQVGVFTTEGKLVASQHFDANGNYQFSLSPGTYRVKASGMKVDVMSTVVGNVTIKSGQTTKLDFDIDTGIR